MGKAYKFVHHDGPLPIAEIEQLYEGYWVFMVNAEFSNNRELLSGQPVIIGSRQYAGAFDGIYDKYKTGEYGKIVDMSLLTNKFITSLRAASGVNV